MDKKNTSFQAGHTIDNEVVLWHSTFQTLYVIYSFNIITLFMPGAKNIFHKTKRQGYRKWLKALFYCTLMLSVCLFASLMLMTLFFKFTSGFLITPHMVDLVSSICYTWMTIMCEVLLVSKQTQQSYKPYTKQWDERGQMGKSIIICIGFLKVHEKKYYLILNLNKQAIVKQGL